MSTENLNLKMYTLVLLLKILSLCHGVVWKDPVRFSPEILPSVRQDTSDKISMILSKVKSLAEEVNKGIARNRFLDFTKDLVSLSDAVLGTLTVKGDPTVEDNVKDVIEKSLRWRKNQSNMMNRAQIKRAFNIWNQMTPLLDKHKDKLGETEMYEVLFTIRTVAIAIQDTVKMQEEPVYILTEPENDNPIIKIIKRSFCLGVVSGGKYYGIDFS